MSIRLRIRQWLAILVAVPVLMTALPTNASAATFKPGGATTVAATQIALNGHTYDVATVQRLKPYIVDNGTIWKLSATAAANLPAATYATGAAFVADSNQVLAAANASVSTPRAPGYSALASSPCLRNIHTWKRGSTIGVQLPDCLVYGAAGILGAIGVIIGIVGSLPGVTAPVAVAVGTAIGAVAALIVAYGGVCDIFGPGNGVEPRYDTRTRRISLKCW